MKTMNRVVIHHTGGLQYDPYYSTQHYTAEDVDLRHWQRWAFKSTMGRYGGYNLFIDRKGVISQFRAIGEETAAQKGFNLDAISICLAGNFTTKVDKPTFAQMISLQNILIAITDNNLDKYNVIVEDEVEISVTLDKIVPHRTLGRTNCYGTGLKDNWARELIYSYYKKKITLYLKLLDAYTMLLDILRSSKVKLGGKVHIDCCLEKDNRG